MSGPVFFGPAERRLFGWFHRGAAGARNCVVLCNPFGFELLCMHRHVRYFAESFARAGLSTLRFDYDGTGDSAGSDRDPDRVRAWLDSIHHAAEHAKRESGADGVCFVGIRLGAMLAAVAASERTDCRGVIAIAPTSSVALYLRELEMLQAFSKLKEAPDGVSGLAPGDMEASGFLIARETAIALKALALAKAPAPRMLIIDRNDRPSASAWAKDLARLGLEPEVRPLPGFVEMNRDPHKAIVPEEMIAAATEWLAHVPAEPAGTTADASPGSATMALGDGVTEEAVFVDRAAGLFGILTANERRSSRAIVLLNAGAQHRIGPNRLWVTLARYWAARGIVVLRLDLSGLGDSTTRPGEIENAVYSDTGSNDIQLATSYLRRERGVKRIDVVGLCGSAYQAFKAAVRGLDVTEIILLNLQCFFFDPSEPAGDIGRTRAASEAKRYREIVLKPEAWRNLFAGKVNLGAASRILRRRLVDIAVSRGRGLARRLQLPLEDDLAAELRAIEKHGPHLRFVFSDGEAGAELLVELAGSIVRDLRRRGAIHIDSIVGADHTFTAIWTHKVLTERLDAWLATGDVRDEPS